MLDARLAQYAHLWTTERDQIALFTVDCYGKQSYLIYHLPSQRIRMIADTELGRQLIQMMLENGVVLLNDKPQGTWSTQSACANTADDDLPAGR
jgi:hypothetical protein